MCTLNFKNASNINECHKIRYNLSFDVVLQIIFVDKIWFLAKLNLKIGFK